MNYQSVVRADNYGPDSLISDQRSVPGSISSHYDTSPQSISNLSTAGSLKNEPTQANDESGPMHKENTTSAKKRKTAGAPGNRGVANLTADQLAKKRANDREAQRAIRERTKTTIEGLEGRIKELEAQKPYQELLQVKAERDQARDECRRLKGLLETIAEIAKVTNPNELSSMARPQSSRPGLTRPFSSASLPPMFNAGPPPFDAGALHTHLQSPMSAVNSSPAAVSPYPEQDQSIQSANGSIGSRPSPLSNSRALQCDRFSQSGASVASYSPGDRLGVNFLLDPTKPVTPHISNMMSISPNYFAEPPLWSRLPKNSASTCPLDTILDEFTSTQRTRLRSGVSPSEILGPEIPYFGQINKSGRMEYRHGKQPSLDLLVDILSKFPDISEAPEMTGVLYVMFISIRWNICPCMKCYERLPVWLRPTTEQLEKPHPIWMDYLPWPYMRNGLIQAFSNGKPITLEAFFVPYTMTLSLNWPYPPQFLLDQDRSEAVDSESTRPISLVGETHMRDLRNWSLGTQFQQTFPNLVNHETRIEDKR